MKKLHLLYISLLLSQCLFSQKMGRVDYVFIEKKTGFNVYNCQIATLFFNLDSSLFIHSKAKAFGEENSIFLTDMEWFKKKKKEEIGAYVVDSIGAGVFKQIPKKRMQFRKLFLSEAYTIEEPEFPTFKWVFIKENKNIGGIKCQKATTKFRGRNYTAWFAPSIPVQDGPWKFNGCPGLILEVYDDADEVLFLFNGIKYPLEEGKNLIYPFPIATPHTFEEFKNAPEIEFQKMKRRALSAQNSSGVINRIVNKEIELEFK